MMTPVVLLIDDEPNLVVGLRAVMQRAGYTVLCAENGTEGLRLAEQALPDLIICDVMMPPPDGFILRSMLATNPRTAGIPFIFLTARTTRDDRLTGLGVGADDYITKPFDRDELLARVRAVLRRDELGRQKGRDELNDQMEHLRREIAQNFSHELRSPIAVVIASLEIAINERFSSDPAERHHFIEEALNGAHRLHALIEDMIALYEIDNGLRSTLRQPIDIRLSFQQPLALCLAYWSSRNLNVQIRVDPELKLAAPREGFKQAAIHLIDNACKFSPEGGRVTIELNANGDGGCVLVVSDQGPGIPVALREQVFERYYQCDQGLCRRYNGLGIGLTIARDFARSLGGEVAFCDVAEGCCVILTIPPCSNNRELAP